MLSKSLAVASFVALAATVSAEADDKPRIYFPRHVKRQFGNSTAVTTFDSTPSSDLSTASESGSSTKRDDGLVGGLISDIFGDGDSSTSDDIVTTVAVTSYVYVQPTSDPTATDSGIVIGPTGIIKSETSATSTATSSSDEGGGLLDPINTLISDIFNNPTSTSGRNSTASSTSGASTATASLTDTFTPTSTEKGLLPSLLPTLSSLLPPFSEATTETTASSFPATSSFIPLLPTTNTTVLEPTTAPTDTSISIPTSTSSDVITTAPTTVPTTLPATTPTTPVVIVNSTSEAPTVKPISSSSTPVVVVNSTSLQPTVLPTTSLPATSVPVTSLTTSTGAAGVTSIKPTATLTNTNDWLPTSIVIEHTSHTFEPHTATDTASSTAMPTNVPAQIAPDNHDEPAPDGTVAIQLGFKYPLNWQFVADHTTAASQIFAFLPKGLADAGQFSEDKIQITKLVPWNTNDKWGYITTLVKLYYPENMVDSLQTQLWAPNSALYNNDLQIVRDLTGVLNPQIDLFGNGVNDASQAGSGADDSGSGDGSFNSNDGGDSSSKQKATTAGIAVGAFGLSVMYGAAMFIVARRYKRKKQSHRRASSVTSSQVSSEMGYAAGSPALMGGALMSRDMSGYGGVAGGRDSQGSGRSGASQSTRTANISAPLAAENSLGWN